MYRKCCTPKSQLHIAAKLVLLVGGNPNALKWDISIDMLIIPTFTKAFFSVGLNVIVRNHNEIYGTPPSLYTICKVE
jgi:hypothetical protein